MRHSLDKKIYIGTMSGTSYDGIDICCLNVDNQISLLKFSSFKYPSQLREDISRTIQCQELSLDRYFDLNRRIGQAFSKSIQKFLSQNKISKKNIFVIYIRYGVPNEKHFRIDGCFCDIFLFNE